MWYRSPCNACENGVFAVIDSEHTHAGFTRLDDSFCRVYFWSTSEHMLLTSTLNKLNKFRQQLAYMYVAGFVIVLLRL